MDVVIVCYSGFKAQCVLKLAGCFVFSFVKTIFAVSK